jgi:hypothetical protein
LPLLLESLSPTKWKKNRKHMRSREDLPRIFEVAAAINRMRTLRAG